jgi:pimeloyl-ACP methyl ester carboxylesterase
MKKTGLLLVAILLMLAVTATVPVFAQNSPVKTIILVHGAWVDGSGWKPVYDILVKDGYTVSVVQEPLTSFSEDVAATRRIIDQQSGPSLLVGHSYKRSGNVDLHQEDSRQL